MRTDYFRYYSVHLISLLLLIGTYYFARLPDLDESERRSLVRQFSFVPMVLPGIQSKQLRSQYSVNQKLTHISAFISGAGGAIAINDLDGDGLPNDLCHIDPRNGKVIIAPVPGTGRRYPIKELIAIHFDPAKMEPMGCLPGDFNEDGVMDVLVYYGGRPPLIFIQDTQGFTPHEIIDHRLSWFTAAGAMADVNNDGHSDLIFGNYYPDGTHVFDPESNKDMQMPHTFSRANNGGINHILLWAGVEEGVPRYREAETSLPLVARRGWTIGVGAADLDNDLKPEIYFANDFGTDRLLHNRSEQGREQFALLTGVRGFMIPTSKRVGKDSFKGMGIDFADLNQDGYPDLLVSNIADSFSFMESHFAFFSTGQIEQMMQGIAPYHDVSDQIGLARSSWGWDIKAADFNNDGRMEVVQTTGFIKGQRDVWPKLQEFSLINDELTTHPEFWFSMQAGDDISGHVHNPFFVQDSSGYYHDLAEDLGIGQPFLSRGIAIADVDGDGDLDFAYANLWEDSYFFLNDSPEPGNFLGLRLLLPVEPSTGFQVYPGHAVVDGFPAIGASAHVELADGRSWVAQVDGGNGHGGKRSGNLHFGLGKSMEEPVKATLAWRDRQGRINRRTVELKPGWHTLVLGS